MNPEKQIQKLSDLMKVLNRDNATSEEVAQLFAALFKGIEELKASINEKFDTNKGEAEGTTRAIRDDLASLEKNIKRLESNATKSDQKIVKDLRKVAEELRGEMDEIMDAIPDAPDLTSIEEKISEVEGKIPDSLKPLQIKEAIESLTGDDRIEKDAIKNIPTITISPNEPSNPKYGDLWIRN